MAVFPEPAKAYQGKTHFPHLQDSSASISHCKCQEHVRKQASVSQRKGEGWHCAKNPTLLVAGSHLDQLSLIAPSLGLALLDGDIVFTGWSSEGMRWFGHGRASQQWSE